MARSEKGRNHSGLALWGPSRWLRGLRLSGLGGELDWVIGLPCGSFCWLALGLGGRGHPAGGWGLGPPPVSPSLSPLSLFPPSLPSLLSPSLSPPYLRFCRRRVVSARRIGLGAWPTAALFARPALLLLPSPSLPPSRLRLLLRAALGLSPFTGAGAPRFWGAIALAPSPAAFPPSPC